MWNSDRKRFFHFFILLNLLGINGAHIEITMCKDDSNSNIFNFIQVDFSFKSIGLTLK
jgi:hypothetical protein